MSKNIIEMEYSSAIEQAKRLEEIANELKTLSKSDVESTLSDLRAGWRGETAVLYVTKGEALAGKILRVADDLEKSASSIRKIAKRIYDAEMFALQLASSRSY